MTLYTHIVQCGYVNIHASTGITPDASPYIHQVPTSSAYTIQSCNLPGAIVSTTGHVGVYFSKKFGDIAYLVPFILVVSWRSAF